MSSTPRSALPSLPSGIDRCDPGGLLRRVLAGEPPGCDVRDLLLLWLLRLPRELDPALAAGCVLAAGLRPAAPAASDLSALLREVADWPRERLARRVRPGRPPH